MRPALIIIFFVMVSGFLSAQIKLDSIEKNLPLIDGKNKVLDLYELCSAYTDTNFTKSVYYGELALSLITKFPNPNLESKLCLKISIAYFNKGQLESSLNYLIKAESIALNNNSENLLAEIYNNFGKVYNQLQRKDNAVLYFEKTLKIYTKLSDTSGLAKIKTQIASIYYDLMLYDKALENLFEAEKLIRQHKAGKNLADIYNHQGIVYTGLKQYQKALECFNASMELFILEGDTINQCNTLIHIASIHFHENNYNLALEKYEIALKFAYQLENNILIANLLLRLSEIYLIRDKIIKAYEMSKTALLYAVENDHKYLLSNCYKIFGVVESKKKNNKEAEINFTKSIVLAKEIKNLKLQKELYILLSNHYKNTKDFEKALHYQALYSELTDSIYLKDATDKIIKMQTFYHLERKDSEIKLLKAQKQLSDIGFKRQRNYFLVSIIFITLLAIITFLLFRIIYINRKSNKTLIDKSLKIQQQSFLLEQANLELQKLTIAIRETDNAILIFDSEGKIEWINAGATRLYGYTLDELIKTKGLNIKQISTYSKISDLFNIIIENQKTVTYESSFVTKSGGELFLQTTITPVLDNSKNVIKLIAIDSDITQIKNVEKRIAKQKDELEKLNAMKNKLFSIIAHDLKNPFNAIIGLSEILRDDFEAINDKDKREYISLIVNAGNEAYNLLNNLLHWSRSLIGNIDCRPWMNNLYEIVEDNISLLKPLAERKKITVINNIPPKQIAFFDENMISTVFRNLISNAIKFTGETGKILISSGQIKNMLQVMVKDNGIGMKKEVKEKIFNGNTIITTLGTSNEKGTGLGLMICKDFIQINGGEINFESDEGKGTTFTFTLPLDFEGYQSYTKDENQNGIPKTIGSSTPPLGFNSNPL